MKETFNLKSILAFVIILILTVVACKPRPNPDKPDTTDSLTFQLTNPQATSLSGQELNSSQPSDQLEERWKEKFIAFQKDPADLDNIIWNGRFTAYMGDYKKAIDIYTEGLNQFPNEPKLLRHRGHRFITIREFDKAIQDFEKAESLIQGKENEIEPDGMPNAQNIPVSSLHGNIYYHLGLAYYLKGDLEESLKAYQSCLETSLRPDNVVSATHWLYMILRQLGRGEEANKVVADIDEEMEIIENHSYHRLCLLYNGQIGLDDVNDQESASANDAVLFGVANWHIYNGQKEEGLRRMKQLVQRKSWNSFGYIAAEAFLYQAQL